MTPPTSTVLACAMPGVCWDAAAAVPPALARFRPLALELPVLERRLAKNVDPERDGPRYAAAVGGLEQLAVERAVPADDRRAFRAALAAHHLPAVAVGGAYFDLLEELRRRGEPVGFTAPGRVGAAVVPPAAVAAHRTAFARAARRAGLHHEPAIRARAAFLRLAAGWGCGVVEPHDPFAGSGGVPRRDGALAPDLPPLAAWWHLNVRGWWAPPAAARAAAAPPADADWLHYSENADRPDVQIEGRLTAQVEQALATGRPVWLNNFRHEAITRVFQKYVARRPGDRPGAARVVYPDGSEARPFPLRILTPTPGWTPTRELPVGLMSIRHLDMDPGVEWYFLRNTEIPRGTQAEADEFCYAVVLAELAELRRLYPGERLLLRLRHTGLESAVVGFYRAVVATLAAEPAGGWFRRRPPEWLRVVPVFHADETTEKRGVRWPE